MLNKSEGNFFLKMFSRKSKLNGDLPKPPTKAEILEDLETFSLDHIALDRTRRRFGDENSIGAFSTSDSSLNAGDSSKTGKRESKDPENELNEWWDTFEKFLSDIDKLELYKKQLDVKKNNFAKLDESIGLMADEMQTRINDSLQKAMDEIPDSEQDLK